MWKQPVPTVVDACNGDELAQTLFQLLVLYAKNSDGVVYLEDNSQLSLKRGQVVFGRFAWGRKFGMLKGQSNKLYLALCRLEKTYKLLSKQKSRNCSIVTIHNYDQWVQFEQSNEQTTSKQKANKEQSKITNKSVKSVKIVKSVNNVAPKVATTFDSKKYIQAMKKHKAKHIHVIAWYWEYKDIQHKNKEQAGSALKRELKAAKALVGYSEEEVIEAMQAVEQADYITKWTLETVHKFIDDRKQIKKAEMSDEEIADMIAEGKYE